MVIMGMGMQTDAPVNEFCNVRNTSFVVGEQINFTVYYAVAGIFVNAGSAEFTSQLERLNGRPVFHITGVGKTHHTYDWIFKVRDQYETFVDTVTMQPLKFIRNVQEGGYKKYENVTFNTPPIRPLPTMACIRCPLAYRTSSVPFIMPAISILINTKPATVFLFPCF